MGSVVFTQEHYQQIKLYTDLLPNSEIACMGYASLDGDNVKVNDVFLVPQVISLGNVEFVETGFPYAVKKAVEEGRLEELKFCWHSHATHAAFFSSTDEDMVRKIRDAGPIDWFASAILNGKGETHAQLDFFQPDGALGDFTKHVTVPLDFTVEGKVLSDAEEKAVAEIEKFCTKKSSTSPKAPGSRQGGTSSKRGKQDGSQGGRSKPGQSLQTTPSQSEWRQPKGRDWKLHKQATEEEWECYVDEADIAHYWGWNGVKNEFKGSAPIPIKRDGDYAYDVMQTIVNVAAMDAKEPELVSIEELGDSLAAADDDAMEHMIENLHDRGQL